VKDYVSYRSATLGLPIHGLQRVTAIVVDRTLCRQ